MSCQSTTTETMTETTISEKDSMKENVDSASVATAAGVMDGSITKGGGSSSSSSIGGLVEKEKEEVVELTYEGTKGSLGYEKAKSYLSTGEFELALEGIETELTKRLSMIGGGENGERHESLAPLYYLYGTTLLYTVEESSQDVQVGAENNEEEAGDLQIAWENLEMARSILSSNTTTTTKLLSLTVDQTLDLAQVHMRLGDLQRANGNYREAISDYTYCLELRKDQAKLQYDRRIADSYYSLGMCCLLLAAESEAHHSSPPESTATTATATPTTTVVWLTKEQIVEYREKSVWHYLECGRILVGIIAQLCDQEVPRAPPVKLPSGWKEMTEFASKELSSLRSQLLVTTTKNPEAHDLMELLQEIQETIDNTQQDQKGLADVQAMKAAQVAAAENDTDPTTATTTTIGFTPTTTTTTTTTPIHTTMMVKKKKKRTDDSKPAAGPEPKRPKAAEPQ